jgi:FixJ family two-component response regulator
VESTEATVYIVDDDSDVREALSRLLDSAGWSSQAYGTAQEFLSSVPRNAAGCILLDVSMPGMSGPELHDCMRERGVTLPVIYLTGQSTVTIGVRAMKAGALDFLEKPVDADALLPLIEKALARDRETGAQRSRLTNIDQRLAKLSGREREVLGHVIAGRLNKQIACDLGIAEKTVKVHRGHVMTKMRVHSVADLVHLCNEVGLGEPVEMTVF